MDFEFIFEARIIILVMGMLLIHTPVFLSAWGEGLTNLGKVLAVVTVFVGAYSVFLAIYPVHALTFGKVLLLLVQTKWRLILPLVFFLGFFRVHFDAQKRGDSNTIVWSMVGAVFSALIFIGLI